MWIFTEHGFLSIVRHRDEKELLLVRARDRESLATFCQDARIDERLIEEHTGADYRFRVPCSDKAVLGFIESVVGDLDYDNFKNRVASTRGRAWHDTLLGVWRLTLSLHDRVADES